MVKPWDRIEPTVVAKFGYRTMVEKTFKMPNGKTKSFTTLYTPGGMSAAVIALTKDRQVIVARQFRPGVERILNELPGGKVERGEDPQVGAERELLEETGYRAGTISALGTSMRDAYSNATWYYYLALDCELQPSGQNLDPDEYIDVILISIEDFLAAAKNDELSDPAAVLFAYDQLKALATV